LELPTVKRLTDELSRVVFPSAAAGDKKKRQERSEQIFDNQTGLPGSSRFVWIFACLVSLAKRGLIPANLKKTRAEKNIRNLGEQLFGKTQFNEDDCEMARAVGSMILTNLPEENLDANFASCANVLRELTSNTRKNGSQYALSDALFPGWVYQYLLHQCEKDSKKSGVSQEKTGSSPFYTKWFTPLWIAEFLVEDAIEKPGTTFLDPACGAGHILVPALNRCVKLLTESGIARDDALQLAVEKQIFGLEIDPNLSAAANFSLYLAARDIDASKSLNCANIYILASAGTSAAALGGSLCLGLGRKTDQNFSICLKQVGREDPIPLQSLPEKFGAIAANPPYMSMRNMPKDLSAFLKQHYPLSKYDLYSAFLELAINLLQDNARASLICQQSVLSISRFKPLRELMSEKCKMETLIQLGSGSFPTRSGEKVNNAIISLRRMPQTSSAVNLTPLNYARILYSEEKKQAEIRGIRSILVPRERQTVMPKPDSKTMMAPWCPAFVHDLFEKHDQLQNQGNGIIVINGLFTCNNKLFVKMRSELTAEELLEYVPYDKGGGRKWYHTTPYMLQWVDSGNVIREYRASRGQSRSLPGEDYYFKPGITYSYIGTQGFKARLLSPDCIFDIASSSVFTPDALRMYMLGFMNAALVRYLLGVLNPTINFQVGDLRRLPYAKPDSSTHFAVSKLADEAVALACEVEKLDNQLSCDETEEFLSWAQAKERVIQADIDSLIFSLYEVPSRVQKQILADPWVVRGQKNVFAAAKKGRRAPAVLPNAPKSFAL